MYAITLYQPWASAVVLGLKQYETRSWPTNARGIVAIHAAKETPKPIIREIGIEWYDLVDRVKKAGLVDEVRRSGISEMPTSAVVGVVGIAGCHPVEEVGEYLAEDELRWGDFSAGRFAWKLIHPLGPARGFVPLVCPGRQGLWELPAAVDRAVNLQIRAITCPAASV